MKAGLVRFYEDKDPSKLENVDIIVQQFTPFELEEELEEKYGTAPAFFAGDEVDVAILPASNAPKRAANGRLTDGISGGGWVSHSKSKHLKNNLASLKNQRTSSHLELMI
jgi:hypothetical protein